jgi:hypothetical protein
MGSVNRYLIDTKIVESDMPSLYERLLRTLRPASPRNDEEILADRLRRFEETRGSVKVPPEVLVHLRRRVFGDSTEPKPEE